MRRAATPGSLTRPAVAFGLLGRPIWSETLASPATITNAAPPISDGAGGFLCCCSPAPNASTGTRIFIPAATRVEFYAQPGDKLAWIAA